MKQFGAVSKVVLFCPTMQNTSLGAFALNVCASLPSAACIGDMPSCLWPIRVCSHVQINAVIWEMRLTQPAS
jgi:hypothetical protein